MILADTSIWIEHFRGKNVGLAQWLEEGAVVTHEFVIEELACGFLRQRDEVVSLMGRLPHAPRVEHEVLLEFIGDARLFGRGIGAVDVHLLAATLIRGDTRLWTQDRPLQDAARGLDVLFEPA